MKIYTIIVSELTIQMDVTVVGDRIYLLEISICVWTVDAFVKNEIQIDVEISQKNELVVLLK